MYFTGDQTKSLVLKIWHTVVHFTLELVKTFNANYVTGLLCVYSKLFLMYNYYRGYQIIVLLARMLFDKQLKIKKHV